MELFVTYGLNLAYAITGLGLIALGLAITFGLLGVMNMAHGEFVALGAYSTLMVQQAGLPFLLAVPLAVILCGAAGLLIEWSVIRHLYRRPFDTLLATWGIAILMRKGIEAAFGREFKSIDQVMQGTVTLFGTDYPSYRLVLIIVTTACFIALYMWYRRSNTGARIKAMVQNPDLAAAVGINTQGLSRLTFVSGTVFAGVAGALIAPLVRVEPLMGFDYLLSSFFILVVGGPGSMEGLITGTALIGSSDTIVSAILDKTAGYLGVLTISILFLWLRPHGLISRR